MVLKLFKVIFKFVEIYEEIDQSLHVKTEIKNLDFHKFEIQILPK